MQNMVGLMFGATKAAAPASAGRDRDTLHSCDLWDLPGGATGDECLARVKAKTEARQDRERQVQERREGKKKALQLKAASINEKGAETIAKLTFDRSLTTWSKLLKSDIESALVFKAIDFPKNAKKPELLQLLMKNVCSFDHVCSVATGSSSNIAENKVPSTSSSDTDTPSDSEHSDGSVSSSVSRCY